MISSKNIKKKLEIIKFKCKWVLEIKKQYIHNGTQKNYKIKATAATLMELSLSEAVEF